MLGDSERQRTRESGGGTSYYPQLAEPGDNGEAQHQEQNQEQTIAGGLG